MKKAGVVFLVLLANLAFGQKDAKNGEEVLLKKFGKAEAVYQERIFCHLNKQVYLPGETLWMQAYVLNARDKSPSLLSSNVIAEITDKTGRSIARKLFFADGGAAPGQFELKGFAPGDYFVKVYTNWMRNFGKRYYFVQPISILPLKPAVDKPAMAAPAFSVHAEGGRLLANLEQKLVIISERPEQHIISGKIKTSSGNEVHRFVVNPGEIPSFYFTPVSGQSYTAELSLSDGRTLKTAIPVAADAGIGINVNPYFRDKIRVSLAGNTAQLQAQDYLILAHAAGKLHKALKVKLSAPQTTIELNRNELAPGVNTLTVFTAQGLPVTERAFFVPADTRKGKLDISLLPAKNRDSLQLQFRLPQNTGQLRYSLSVLPAATQAWKDQQSLYSFAFLDDQLAPHAYASAAMTSSGAFSDLNNIDQLLIAFGGRKFNWDWVAALSENPFKYEFERGLSIKGTLAGLQQKKDKGQVDLYSAENHLMLNSKADSLGRFTFERLFLLDSTKLSLTAGNSKGRNAALTATQLWSVEEESLQKKELPPAIHPDGSLTALNFGELIRPLKNVQLKEVNIVSAKKPAQRSGIYQKGINDDSFVIDESTVKRFNSLIDLLRGKFMLDINDMGAGDIQIKMRGGMLGLNAGGNVQSRNPVIVIDGMIVNDLNYLRDLNIFDLEEVAINKTGINLLGPSGSNGAIFIKTRTTPIDFSRVSELDSSDKTVQWIVARGYTEARKFSVPQYGPAANSMPHQAILPVFWETSQSSLESNKVLSFKLPFPCKDLILILEGIDQNGLLYSERKKIQIP
ncbi:hypothetical protein ABIE26_004797 [Pedobacter africanus]|uniref:Uncharacterized protein n=1 Tax=Pedobacter africanus TaxID=151894 RepID=A0ACC6L2M2_9SPHI|nr:hypothetical protein [Pedobacter africanus]MDR6785734.1 hypothetical protein [Pedobacter africanus]